MAKAIKYYIVAADALPEIFVKVAEAKRMMQTGEVDTVGAATKLAGISRSAFYKYKDSVQPFNDMKSEHIITFYGMLKDTAGDGFIGKIHNEVVALQQDEEVAQIMTMEEEYERRNTAARREGLEQGRAEGEAAAVLKLARAMKSKGLDTDAIAEITGLSGEEIDKL